MSQELLGLKQSPGLALDWPTPFSLSHGSWLPWQTPNTLPCPFLESTALRSETPALYNNKWQWVFA